MEQKTIKYSKKLRNSLIQKYTQPWKNNHKERAQS